MKTSIAMLALLASSGSAWAQSQDVTRNPPPPSVKRAQQGVQPRPGMDAPISQRQPRAGDVPETGTGDPGRIDAQDRELDRMIKNICKGC